MSLGIFIQNDSSITICSDSRVSTKMGSDRFVLTDTSNKVFLIKNKLVFACGSLQLTNLIIKSWAKGKSSISRLQEISKVLTKKYLRNLGPEEVEKYTDKNGLNVASFVVSTFEGGMSVIYKLSSHKDYEVEKVKNKGKFSKYHTAGFHSDEAMEKLLKLNDVNSNSILKLYSDLSGEEVGGTLSIVQLRKNGLKSLFKAKIPDKKDLKRLDLDLIGGFIKTAESGQRLEFTENQLRTFNDSEEKHGVCTNSTSQDFGDLDFYDNGELIFSLYNPSGGAGAALIPRNGRGLTVGANNLPLLLRGDVGGAFWRGTEAEFEERKALGKFVDKQIIEITDHGFDLGENLPVGATLSDVINKVNALLNMLREMRVIDE